jgi:DNA helicase IV
VSELAAEQRHLDATSKAYDAMLRALSSSRRAQAVDEFSEEALERMRLERLRAYTAASGPLYFGRIDRAGGPLYIGRHAVADADNELLAINWRAPAAEPFYAATPADPRGVTRRRRLDIEDRTVLGYVDEELGSGGEEHLTEAIVADITAQRVGEMRQIISTITPEQYALISEPPAGALVVQGGPGTGKTAVGLHRAAWLLYADPALARAGVLVVGPNRTFIAYISQVLPALGEQSVEQRPIDALVTQRRWAGTETEERATLLGSGRMAAVLAGLLWARVGPPPEPETLAVARAEVRAEPDELADLIAEARAQRRSYQAGRERFRERLAGRLATHAIARSRLAAASDPEAVIGAVRRTRAYQKLADRCWPRQTPEALVRSLFRQRRRLEAAAAGLLADSEIALLLASDPPGRTGTMTHAEFALLDEARALIDPELRTYGHVVLDEAQNLSPMELRMVVRRARGQSLTVLGDIAQRTAEARLESWESVLGDAGVAEIRIAELLVSYRVPDDFLRLAAAIAPGATVPQGVRRAPWPAVAVATSAERVGIVALGLAERMAADVGSVGVVVPAALRPAVDGAFAGHASAAAEDAGGRLSGGIDLLGLAAIKGLEFDAAVVVEPAAILAERPDGGTGGLYTALTRSTRALAVVHAGELPAGLDLPAVPEAEAAAAWAAGRL